MLNSIDFSTRIKKIMDYYGTSASAFADSIDVPRSSISHILSGRNKPSLDFVLKITHTYNDVDLYWLLNGKGHFPKKTPSPTSKSNSTPLKLQKKEHEKIDSEVIQQNKIETTLNSEIEKVFIFYKDGTFKEYHNRD
ncbi:helix-turn-helix domain-containing protein [Bacteroidota bacterium]